MVKVKNFFLKIGSGLKTAAIKTGRWFKNHVPSRRRIIQVYAALLTNANIKGFVTGRIYRGGTKNLCTPGLNCYSCPGAVAACPLGALQNALAKSNTSTPYFILGILGILGLMFGRTICGFFCPVGLGQELLHKIKTPKLKKSRYTRVLSYFKYVLLAVLVIAIPIIYQGIPAFCKFVCPAGTFGGAGALLANPNNADYFDMLGYLFSWKFVLLVVFVVGSIFIYRFFCRFFCPLGAIYGFFNKIALIGVKLDKEKCIECGLCLQTCQMDIKHVGDHECINCGACISVCPTKAISWKGSKIFLHNSEVEKAVDSLQTAQEQAALQPATEQPMAEQPQTEGKPLTALLAAGTTQSTQTATIRAEIAAEDEATEEGVIPPTESFGLVQPTQTAKASANSSGAMQKVPKNRKRGRNFWLEFAAWAMAAVVLIVALVYYNFLAPANSTVVFAVGDKCPDFTLTLFESEGNKKPDGGYYGKFSTNLVADDTVTCKDSVTVINFWYTTCDPCVAELPYFAEVKEDYGDSIVMVAIQTDLSADVQKFIDLEDPSTNKTSWREWGIVFAQEDESVNAYAMLGGKDVFPMTVIIDANGIITYVRHGSLEEATLRKEIDSALNK